MLDKKTIIALVIGIVIGASLYFLMPKETVTITKTVESTQIKTDTDIKKNTVTKIIETKRPDGTTVTETEIKNQDEIKSQMQLNQDKKTESYAATSLAPKNRISAKALLDISQLRQPYYELNVSRQVWGPLRVEGAIDTRGEKRIGAVIEINF